MIDPPLTPREHQVLYHILEFCLSNKQIANRLNIDPKTVETHRSRVMVKYKARNLADLARVYWSDKLTTVAKHQHNYNYNNCNAEWTVRPWRPAAVKVHAAAP